MADETQVAQEQTAPAVDQPTIGLQDLQNAIKVIDYACDQGAFKGWQVIEQVAAVRSKLAAFVAAATPPEEPKAPEAPAKAKKTKAAPVKAEAKPAAEPKATAAKNAVKKPVKAKK